jgi:hypothetical protein
MAENDELIGDQPDEEPDGEQISGTDDLLYALAEALRLKKSKEALASLILRSTQTKFRSMQGDGITRCFGRMASPSA